MRLLICGYIVVLSTIVLTAISASNSAALSPQNEKITVFLTGQTLGALKPCGCFGGQLGGLDRRPAIFDSVPPEKRLIIDTGNFVPDSSEQNLIKFDIITMGLSILGYDVVNLNEEDIEIARSRGFIGAMPFNTISAYQPEGTNIQYQFTKEFQLNDEPFRITVTSVESEFGEFEDMLAPQPEYRTLNIFVANACDSEDFTFLSQQSELADVLVCPDDSDIARVKSKSPEKPLVISVGKLGEYVGKLEIAFDEKHQLKLDYSAAPVYESLPQAEPLVDLYKNYQEIVKDARLLEKHPRFFLPDGLMYTGSSACKICHEHRYNYDIWSTKAHAGAYQTLIDVGSQYDPECVVCHVVGMDYKSGFITAEKTPYLKDVGCEVCHGPGLEHIWTLGKAKTRGPKLECLDCHTPEHSGNYAGNELIYREKIKHWTEPNDTNDVK
jgi:hypothetical protein